MAQHVRMDVRRHARGDRDRLQSRAHLARAQPRSVAADEERGFVAARASRHDLVAAGGLAVNALAILVVAIGLVPTAALPAALAIAEVIADRVGSG